jgi:hypothetical protein
MGLLDLPAPLLSWIDGHLLAFLPPLARIAVWGAIGAILSMAIYWLLSPQERMEKIAVEEKRVKRVMQDEAISREEGLAAAKELLRLALTRLALVTLPVLIAALPVVGLMSWLDNHYAYTLPPRGETPSVTLVPQVGTARWVAEHSPPRIEILDGHGAVLQSFPMTMPIPVIGKWVWWNVLIGNPLGYLAADSPLDHVEIGLAEKHYIQAGPSWMQGWAAPFLISILIVSLIIKIGFRIH